MHVRHYHQLGRATQAGNASNVLTPDGLQRERYGAFLFVALDRLRLGRRLIAWPSSILRPASRAPRFAAGKLRQIVTERFTVTVKAFAAPSIKAMPAIAGIRMCL